MIISSSAGALASRGAAAAGWWARRSICQEERVRVSWSSISRLAQSPPGRLYDKLYRARRDGKPYQGTATGLLAGRTGAHWARANQLRPYFSSFTFVLMYALRRLGTNGTPLACARCSTLRLKLLQAGRGSGSRPAGCGFRSRMPIRMPRPLPDYCRTYSSMFCGIRPDRLRSLAVARSDSRRAVEGAVRPHQAVNARLGSTRHDRSRSTPLGPRPIGVIGAPSPASSRSPSFTENADRNGESVTDTG